MKLKEVVSLYKILGEAKVSNLDESEIIKIVKARKLIRQSAEEYNAFLKDVQEKFKPENFEYIQNALQNWNNIDDQERIEVNKVVRTYELKINTAVAEELEKDVDVVLDKLSEESVTKLLKHNDWKLNKLDELQPML